MPSSFGMPSSARADAPNPKNTPIAKTAQPFLLKNLVMKNSPGVAEFSKD
jgi:hypothetical protein